jgi:hypothetical protein
MQHLIQTKLLVAQPTGNSTTPISVRKTDLSMSDYTIMLTLTCLPMIFFAGILGKNAYHQRRARQLKEQIMKLEKAWKATYTKKQDR